MVRNISALSTIHVIRFLCWTFQWLLPLSLSQPPKDSAPIGDEPPKNTHAHRILLSSLWGTLHRLIHFLGTFPKPLPVFAKSRRPYSLSLTIGCRLRFMWSSLSTKFVPHNVTELRFMSPCTVSVIHARARMQRDLAHAWRTAVLRFHTPTGTWRMWAGCNLI